MKTVYVGSIGTCDVCSKTKAAYDTPVKGDGRWGHLCEPCFKRLGHPTLACKITDHQPESKVPEPARPNTMGAVLQQKEKAKRIKDHVDQLSMEEIEEMMFDGIVPTACPDGCEVEPDGQCCHGYPSPLRMLGII